MLAQARYEYITEQISKIGSVTVNGISSALSVSPETVRRDLIALEAHGKLKRVFGGAVAAEASNRFESLGSRLDTNRDKKAELSRYALGFVNDGDVIAVESGSTAAEFAKALLDSELNIIIITHSDTVFNILKNKFRVVLIGGEYISADDCFGGALAEEFLKKFHANKAFLFPSAISLEHGIEGFIPELQNMQLILSEIADQTFVLADSDKFNTRGMFKVLELKPDFIYITDSNIASDVKKAFSDSGMVLISEEQ